MEIEKQLEHFDYQVHTQKSFWMLGCCGPFGIVDMRGDDKITYKIIKLHGNFIPVQTNGVNCGVIWCLFVFDLMQQAAVPYNFLLDDTNGVMPFGLGIGKTWIISRL